MNLLKGLETTFETFLKLLKLITCLVLVFITLSVCVEVVLRYFFNKPQVWVIELSEYGLLYLTFLAAAWVLKAEAHIAVDLITDRLSQRARSFLSVIHYILIFGVSTVLIWYGARVTWSYFSKGTYNPTILEVPTAAILVVIPFGGVFLFFQSLRGIISSVLKYERLRPGADKRNASRGRES